MSAPDLTLPRGIRNCNPGNISAMRGLKWQHQTGYDGEGYCIFDAAEWGIRAGAVIIQNYKYYHGIDTIQGIIGRWCPTNDDHMRGYIRYVSNACRVAPTDVIDICELAFPLTVSMIFFENGRQPYSAEIINRGIELAHVR